MKNTKAPKGKLWVCCACGKMSKDKYGDKALSYGWDESCVMNSSLFYKKDLIIEKDRVVKVKPCVTR